MKLVFLVTTTFILFFSSIIYSASADLLNSSVLENILGSIESKGSSQTTPKNGGIAGQQRVSSPEIPHSPHIEKTYPSQIQSSKKNTLINTTIFIAGVKSFQGVASLSKIELMVNKESHQYHFHKVITLQDIKRITVIRWKAFLMADYKTYQFLPVMYLIETRDKNKFTYYKNIKALNKFELHTPMGKTWLFSYFIDYISQENTWTNIGLASNVFIIDIPISTVVNKIEFGATTDSIPY